MNVISRAEAKARGLSRYFTGKLCKRGGIGERTTSCGNCLCEMCIGEKSVSDAKWRLENEGRVKNNQREYAKRNREKLAANQRTFNEKNPGRRAEISASWRAKNPCAAREFSKRWRANNPDHRREESARRRAMRRAALPKDFSEFDRFVILEASRACRRRAKMHGEIFHIDHMTPLSRGGLHCATNVQVIPARLNLWKNNRLVLTSPGEWIAYA